MVARRVKKVSALGAAARAPSYESSGSLLYSTVHFYLYKCAKTLLVFTSFSRTPTQGSVHVALEPLDERGRAVFLLVALSDKHVVHVVV